MSDSGTELLVTDYVVFFGTVILSLAIGVFYAYRDRNYHTTLRYHRGGGKLNAFPVALSMIVTFESSIFYLGIPAEVYIHGFIYWLSNISVTLSALLMLTISIPLFYPLQITSVFEYLQIRHGPQFTRRFTSLLSVLYMTLYGGIVLFGPAIALESVTNIPQWLTVICCTVIAVVYTSLGGIKAVIWTDVLQALIMVVGIFAVIIKGLITVGGVSNVIDINKPSGRLQLVDFNPDPYVRHTFWTIVLGGFFRYIGICFRQPTVQRLNSTRSVSEARKVVFISIIGFFILHMLVMFEGLVAYAYFHDKGCDPLASGQISNPNQIISYLVVDMFGSVPGISGLFLAALFSASLSTISSLLSSTSAVISEDIVRLRWKAITEAELTLVSKVIVVCAGAVCAGIGLLIGNLKGSMSQIAGSILGCVSSPPTGIFLMSIFVSWVTQVGIMVGALAGIGLSLWLSTGYNFSSTRKQTPWLPLGPTYQCFVNATSALHNATSYSWPMDYTTPTVDMDMSTTTGLASSGDPAIHGLDYLYSISYQYFGMMVLIVTVVVGLLVSRMTKPDRQRKVPDHLLLSLKQSVTCCLPDQKQIRGVLDGKTYRGLEMNVGGCGSNEN